MAFRGKGVYKKGEPRSKWKRKRFTEDEGTNGPPSATAHSSSLSLESPVATAGWAETLTSPWSVESLTALPPPPIFPTTFDGLVSDTTMPGTSTATSPDWTV